MYINHFLLLFAYLNMFTIHISINLFVIHLRIVFFSNFEMFVCVFKRVYNRFSVLLKYMDQLDMIIASRDRPIRSPSDRRDPVLNPAPLHLV